MLKAIKALAFCTWAFSAVSQCPGDSCNNPQLLTAPEPGEQACAEEVCNGSFIGGFQWNCSMEQQGEPGTCWSQEFDYWVLLTVNYTGAYVFDLTSNYQAPPFTPPPVMGGVQMAVYNLPFCSPGMSPVNTFLGEGITPCSSTPEGQAQNYQLELELSPGQYLIQIDGFGFSYGCSLLCVNAPGFLSIDHEENIEKPPEEAQRYYQKPRKVFHPVLGFLVVMPNGKVIDATFRQIDPLLVGTRTLHQK